ncbi:hypothetical protein ABBQ38_008647 [Trebouxia sp. C0009 RCD-2024]
MSCSNILLELGHVLCRECKVPLCSEQVCHRDIKHQNLPVNKQKNQLKLCGSAVPGCSGEFKKSYCSSCCMNHMYSTERLSCCSER